ncbi:UDP-2,4-diacetamido-2,4,6-trideoxy-beta-L-altropyranose hydrolase [Pseudoalteromonas fenneropenaei]|uniref:UDP-2,4-diacetamido-2,4, 6-trideoxy-beta-L-altropyranose hydrolase n=1 Tax=Pseudoalteromonas fenneropenaei TaxID=1737459 RepID=A0ABV7CGW9_9GAMM
MQVLFRVDSSANIGSGHFMRCLTLAKAFHHLTQCAIHFIAKEILIHHETLLAENQFLLTKLPPNLHIAADAQHSIASFDIQLGPNVVVVDHYQLDQSWETPVREHCAHLLVIDDLANRIHDCDSLLDQTYLRHKNDYRHLVSPKTNLLLGCDYSLLRREFIELREHAVKKRMSKDGIREILICFGSTDPINATSQTLDAILPICIEHQIKINIVLSSSAPHLLEISERVANSSLCTLHVDSTAVAKLMLDADLAIGANGTLSWERCCLGLPAITTDIAANQVFVGKALAQTGAIVHLGQVDSGFATRLKQTFEQLLQANTAYLSQMVNQAFALVDGKGAQKVIQHILQSRVALRPATLDDTDLLFAWQSNPEVRKYSRNPKPVEFNEHVLWLRNTLANSKRALFIIIDSWTKSGVGMLRLDQISELELEISILVAPEHQGAGYADAAIHALDKSFKRKTIHAYLDPKNLKSSKLFARAGFKAIHVDHFVRFPDLRGD